MNNKKQDPSDPYDPLYTWESVNEIEFRKARKLSLVATSIYRNKNGVKYNYMTLEDKTIYRVNLDLPSVTDGIEKATPRPLTK